MIMTFRIFLITTICVTASTLCAAQNSGSAEYRSPGDEARSLRKSKPLKESLERMRIARDKKEYEEMMSRGDEMLRRTMQLERSVEVAGSVTDSERGQIAMIEKLAKQIRKQLGGDDDDYQAANKNPMSTTAAVKSLRSATTELHEQLKKTSRFTVSAAAIQSSNEVLRIARYLKSSNN
jgi:hypothetical protein